MRNFHPVSVAVRLLTGLTLATLVLAGCSTEEPDGPRNLVVVTVDTLRADRLQTYGYFRDVAPNIDALAGESLVFERCLAPIAQTTPSHLSLMTSLYPFEHGVSNNFARLSPEAQREQAFASSDVLRTFAQTLGDGVHTAGFVSAAPVKRLTGLANGFRTWDEPSETRRSGQETNQAALAWLANQTGPFFMWVHYMDAHGPYAVGLYPPAEYAERYQTDAELEAYLAERRMVGTEGAPENDIARPDVLANLYDGSVKLADDAVGELLDALRAKGLWEETVVVLLSDHGQGLWQHYAFGHGDVWDEQLRVPLLMRVPGEAPRRLAPLMGIIDVMPTALALVDGFEAGGFLRQARGRNVLAPDFDEPVVFGMGDEFTRSFSLIEGDWKIVRRSQGPSALFSLRDDPFELTDVSGEFTERAAELEARLSAEIEAQRAKNAAFRSGSATSLPVTDTEHLDELRDLGYLGHDDEDEPDEDEPAAESPPK